jgi:glycosyltransferase involved in cell wall biosynthesis
MKIEGASDPALVSVIICAYNAGAFLQSSIRSVLNQTYDRLEVLVVDDGSTDGSVDDARKAIRDPRVRWFHQPNSGKSVGLNRALSEARGSFYAIQDADDLSYPQRIARQVRCMLDCPDVAAVFCGHDLILAGRRAAPLLRAKDCDGCRRDVDRFRMPAHDPTGMYRMSMVGGMRYEPSLRIAQGYDYILRVGERFPMMVLGECLYSYRYHAQSVTKADPDRRHRFVADVIRRACERRNVPFRPPPRRRWSLHRRREFGLAWHLMESSCDLVRAGRRSDAIRTGLTCAGLHPLDPHYHKAWLLAVAPLFLHPLLRRASGN